nr:MAG TPA: hypothetical protein [Caudoviricetes sp.]
MLHSLSNNQEKSNKWFFRLIAKSECSNFLYSYFSKSQYQV